MFYGFFKTSSSMPFGSSLFQGTSFIASNSSTASAPIQLPSGASSSASDPMGNWIYHWCKKWKIDEDSEDRRCLENIVDTDTDGYRIEKALAMWQSFHIWKSKYVKMIQNVCSWTFVFSVAEENIFGSLHQAHKQIGSAKGFLLPLPATILQCTAQHRMCWDQTPM